MCWKCQYIDKDVCKRLRKGLCFYQRKKNFVCWNDATRFCQTCHSGFCDLHHGSADWDCHEYCYDHDDECPSCHKERMNKYYCDICKTNRHSTVECSGCGTNYCHKLCNEFICLKCNNECVRCTKSTDIHEVRYNHPDCEWKILIGYKGEWFCEIEKDINEVLSDKLDSFQIDIIKDNL